jgi:hypothetical protein
MVTSEEVFKYLKNKHKESKESKQFIRKLNIKLHKSFLISNILNVYDLKSLIQK